MLILNLGFCFCFQYFININFILKSLCYCKKKKKKKDYFLHSFFFSFTNFQRDTSIASLALKLCTNIFEQNLAAKTLE